MAALAVSFGLPFRETLDFALFLKNKKSFYPNHPYVQCLSDLNVSWFCQHFCIFVGCVRSVPNHFVWLWPMSKHSVCVWCGGDFSSVYLLDLLYFVYSVQVPLWVLKIMVMMFSNVEKMGFFKFNFSLCAFVMTVFNCAFFVS